MNVSLDPDSLREWQNEDMECLRYAYEIFEGDRVLDIGSYRREWGSKFEELGSVVEYFDALDDRAAWVEDGFIRMGGAFYYTSMFEQGGQAFKCVDIAPYLQEETQLVKINIEGMEYGLLKYIIDKGLIKNIVHLQVQFHQIEGQPWQTMYGELALSLAETHKLEWRYPFVWESWQRI